MIYPLKEKEGMLRLYHRKESIAEAAYCSYLGLRQKSYRFENCASHSRYFSDELDAQFF